MTVSCTRSALTGAAATGDAAATAGGGAVLVVADVDVGVDVAVVVVAGGGVVFAGAGFLASSGKSFGAIAAHPQRKAIEITIARKIRFSISRDGVPTSRIERVAARQAPDAEPDAAQHAVFLDGLHRIHRARRFETAHR